MANIYRSAGRFWHLEGISIGLGRFEKTQLHLWSLWSCEINAVISNHPGFSFINLIIYVTKLIQEVGRSLGATLSRGYIVFLLIFLLLLQLLQLY